MLKELRVGFLMMAVMTLLTGAVYPAVVTAIAQVLFPSQANGSLIVSNGRVVGSRLLGQGFSKPEYFHGRPSSAGAGYDGLSSAGSNLGPTSAKLINGAIATDAAGKASVAFEGLKLRIVHYCVENDIPYDASAPLTAFQDASGAFDDVKLIRAFSDETAPFVFKPRVALPADAVAGSASGLDPHISPENAALQVPRVARARGVSPERVRELVQQFSEGRTWGVLGEPHVNVLELNLAMDRESPVK